MHMRSMQLPARVVIFQARIRDDVVALRAQCNTLCAQARRGWRLVMPWLAGASIALAYLLGCSYMERGELERDAVRAAAVTKQLGEDKAELEAQLAEITATRTQQLIYLIEAGSTTEAKDKLSRLALMVATEHFNLQEATTKRTKK